MAPTKDAAAKRRSSTSSAASASKPKATTSSLSRSFSSTKSAVGSTSKSKSPALGAQASATGAKAGGALAGLTKEQQEEKEEEDELCRAYPSLYKSSTKTMGPAIHGQNLNPLHIILMVFDHTDSYGPTVGLSRLERYERAVALGLDPPSQIGEILRSKTGKRSQYARSTFSV